MKYSSLSKMQRGTRELGSRLLFLFCAIVIFRIGVQTPLPGIDLGMVADLFQRNKANMIIGYFDIFTGGALSNMSLLALSIYPYISSSIVIQLLSHSYPKLEQLRKDGERGRQVLNQYTRYLTFFIAILQSFGVAKFVLSMNMSIVSPGFFYLLAITSLATGTMFMMWLGDQITRFGIGNGISMIMFSGIVSKLPETLLSFFSQAKQGQISSFVLFSVLSLISLTIALVVFMERAQRNIPLTYPRRQQYARSPSQSQAALPLKLNMTGVLPPIVAQMLLVVPVGAIDYLARKFPENPIFSSLGSFFVALQPGTVPYFALFMSLVLTFAFYLTTIFFNTKEVAENLKRSGAMIIGVRPGVKTSAFIDQVLSKTTLIGATYLAFVAVVPDILVRYLKVPALFGGTSLLISVVVIIEFSTQVQTYLLPNAHPSSGNVKRTSLLD